MSDPKRDLPDETPPVDPPIGDPGEHPLSILLFSWMRGKIFPRVFDVLLWQLAKPAKDVTAMPGFYAGFGFLAFAFAVLSGWPLGKLLRRPESYYDTRSGEAGRDR
jgi:hypothetical protein